MRNVAFKTVAAVTAAICEMMSWVKALFQTVMFDHGIMFTLQEKIAKEMDGQIYFVHSNSFKERGINENVNGLIHQYFP